MVTRFDPSLPFASTNVYVWAPTTASVGNSTTLLCSCGWWWWGGGTAMAIFDSPTPSWGGPPPCRAWHSAAPNGAPNKYSGESIPEPHQRRHVRGMFVCQPTPWPQEEAKKDKKRFASLRFCVSSLHRDHALRSLHSKARLQSSLRCKAIFSVL